MQHDKPFPTWMMNGNLNTDGTWKMLPTKPLLPACVPAPLSKYGCVWKVEGPPQGLLASAVATGVFLRVSELTKLRDILKFPMPSKGSGSGANGNIVKEDYCKALIEYLHPSATKEEKAEMLQTMMGKVAGKVRCPAEIIAAVKDLGADAERDFMHLHQAALNQQKVEEQRNREPSERRPSEKEYEQRTFTPKTLKDLLPDVQGVWCNRSPLVKRYQVGYPGPMLSWVYSLPLSE